MKISFSGIINTVFIAAFVLMYCALKTADAQRASSDIESLTEQMEELQSRLASVSNQQATQRFASERVKDVGSQLVRKPIRLPEEDATLKIRLYDLSDLFVVVPNYAAAKPRAFASSSTVFSGFTADTAGSSVGGGGFGGGGIGGSVGGGGGVFRIASQPLRPTPRPEAASSSSSGNMSAAQVTMEQMISTIQETVKPGMWDSGDATVKRLGNTLLIAATESMHSQINNLLNLFREHWGKRRTVNIQTYWIRAKHAHAFDLLDRKSNDELGAGVVADEAWKSFLDKAKSESAIEYSATVTGHNNQTLHAYSGKQVMLTVGAIPLESSSGWTDWHEMVDANYDEDDEDLNMVSRTRKTTGFAPVRESFHDGVVVQMTPLATRGGNYVILDVQAMANRLLVAEEGKRQSVFSNVDGVRNEVILDDTSYATSRFSSTIRCPKDKVVLAGSMTFESEDSDKAPELFVFVRACVHTIEEDKSDWKRVTLDDSSSEQD